MSIFTSRTSFKPFEYPDVVPFKNAINNSYWLVGEWNFVSDVQDFKVRLNPDEQEAIKRTLLAISQIEVSVKRFWTSLGTRIPKPEIEQVGVTFGESEVRHADAYSHLISILGLQDDFEALVDHPVVMGRINYLKKYLNNFSSDEEYIFVLTLFSIFIENVSLFSQFLIIKSFSKHKNMLKDIDNVVQATQKEETVHAMFGMHLIREIQNEFPSWFDDTFYEKLAEVSTKAVEAESAIVDWIFENGTLDFLSPATVKEFIKYRINESLVSIGGKALFSVDEEHLESVMWFMDEMWAEVNTDFFFKKPVTYAKMTQPVTAGDLF